VRVLMNPSERPASYNPIGRMAWVQRLGDGPLSRAMMALMAEGTAMLMNVDDRGEAERLVEATLRWINVVEAVGF